MVKTRYILWLDFGTDPASRKDNTAKTVTKSHHFLGIYVVKNFAEISRRAMALSLLFGQLISVLHGKSLQHWGNHGYIL